MLLRKCAETVRGTRSSFDVGHRRRHRGGAARLIAWPADRRAPVPPEVAPPELLPARPSVSSVQQDATGAPTGLLWLWRVLGQSPAAREQWSELLRLATTSAEREVRAETLNAVGQFACNAGDQTTAQAFFQEALVAGDVRVALFYRDEIRTGQDPSLTLAEAVERARERAATLAPRSCQSRGLSGPAFLHIYTLVFGFIH